MVVITLNSCKVKSTSSLAVNGGAEKLAFKPLVTLYCACIPVEASFTVLGSLNLAIPIKYFTSQAVSEYLPIPNGAYVLVDAFQLASTSQA